MSDVIDMLRGGEDVQAVVSKAKSLGFSGKDVPAFVKRMQQYHAPATRSRGDGRAAENRAGITAAV